MTNSFDKQIHEIIENMRTQFAGVDFLSLPKIQFLSGLRKGLTVGCVSEDTVKTIVSTFKPDITYSGTDTEKFNAFGEHFGKVLAEMVQSSKFQQLHPMLQKAVLSDMSFNYKV